MKHHSQWQSTQIAPTLILRDQEPLLTDSMCKGPAITKNLQNLRNQQQNVEKKMIEQNLWRLHDETQTQLQH